MSVCRGLTGARVFLPLFSARLCMAGSDRTRCSGLDALQSTEERPYSLVWASAFRTEGVPWKDPKGSEGSWVPARVLVWVS